MRGEFEKSVFELLALSPWVKTTGCPVDGRAVKYQSSLDVCRSRPFLHLQRLSKPQAPIGKISTERFRSAPEQKRQR